MIQILITGTGRCGTGYMARVLDSARVACGHEAIFSHGGLEAASEQMKDRSGLRAESSWLAVPFLKSELLKGVTIVHLVRAPRKTIESIISVRIFDDSPYSQFARRYQPELSLWETEQDIAAEFYLGWNEMIEHRAHIRHRVEDDPQLLLTKLGITHEGPLFGDTTYNTRPEYPAYELDWRAIDLSLRVRLGTMSERYGYQPV